MSGLSTSTITATLAAQRTSAATQQLILQFLNGVANANALAGIEPQQGPVEDSPASGPSDQVRDYDIGPLVAQRWSSWPVPAAHRTWRCTATRRPASEQRPANGPRKRPEAGQGETP